MAKITEKLILRTFEEMLEEQPFDRITVRGLVTRCEINPNTFYYHYSDIFDLLEKWIRQELAPYLHPENDFQNWHDSACRFLKQMQKKRTVIYHIFNSLSREYLERFVFDDSEDVFVRYVRWRLNGKTVSEQRLLEIADFCRFACLGFVIRFLWERMDYDADQAVEELSGLFELFVEEAIRRFAEPQDSEQKQWNI